MKPAEILACREHRVDPMPERRWSSFQRWLDLAFLHWPVAPAAISPLLPPDLELDLFEGDAWVGVVPFRMSGIRLRGLPAVPGLRAFPELNVRTYARHGGRSGVYFFSLDATNPVAVAIARRWYHLPYFHATMSLRYRGDEVEYECARRRGEARFAGSYGPTAPVERAAPGSFEHWLVERYCLFAWNGTRLLRGDIHHEPWPLRRAEAEIEVETMAAASGITLPDRPPVCHFARKLDVLIWSLAK